MNRVDMFLLFMSESDKGWDRVTSGECDEQLTDGAELNTTLALRAELQEVAEQAFDPEKAVKEKLQISTLTKNHISAKAAEGETTKHHNTKEISLRTACSGYLRLFQ